MISRGAASAPSLRWKLDLFTASTDQTVDHLSLSPGRSDARFRFCKVASTALSQDPHCNITHTYPFTHITRVGDLSSPKQPHTRPSVRRPCGTHARCLRCRWITFRRIRGTSSSYCGEHTGRPPRRAQEPGDIRSHAQELSRQLPQNSSRCSRQFPRLPTWLARHEDLWHSKRNRRVAAEGPR